MLLRNAIETAQMAFGLVPEILDPINVISSIRKPLSMVNPMMLKDRNIQHIVGGKSVGIDDAVGHDSLLPDGL